MGLKRTITAYRVLAALTVLTSFLMGGLAQAQWPERPITLVVMYAPGGGTDTVLRTLAAEMSEATGWRINVVNRPGAAGTLATNFVSNRPNDGYTLLEVPRRDRARGHHQEADLVE